jgi:hypothetical protein
MCANRFAGGIKDIKEMVEAAARRVKGATEGTN